MTIRSPFGLSAVVSPLFFLLTTIQCSREATALSSSSLFSSSSHETTLPRLNAAVVVPGFLTGASELRSLVDAMNARGLPTVAVPFPNWHWIPCLDGRSVRPILERIDHAVRHVAASGGDVDAVPDFSYSWADCVGDFLDNPGGVRAVGGSTEVDDFPVVEPRGRFPRPVGDAVGRVAIVGHSAGGWIARAYLSDRDYGGRSYGGRRVVHSLVTLGSPHGNAPGPAFRSVEWVNREEGGVPAGVRTLAVSGSGFPARSSGTFTRNSYSFCRAGGGSCDDDDDGDGVTPIDSATAVDGAETLVLEGRVTHFPWSDVAGGEFFAPDLARAHREEGTPWYGSDEALDQWVGWLSQDAHHH